MDGPSMSAMSSSVAVGQVTSRRYRFILVGTRSAMSGSVLQPS
jgi:hypothetical protein